jgi:hypothetical protein
MEFIHLSIPARLAQIGKPENHGEAALCHEMKWSHGFPPETSTEVDLPWSGGELLPGNILLLPSI